MPALSHVTWVLVMCELAHGYESFITDPPTASSYRMSLIPATWGAAYLQCVSERAHLVVINSQTEADIVKNLFSRFTKPLKWYTDFLHVGIQVVPGTRSWVTVEGRLLGQTGYEQWNSDEPNNDGGHENCGVVNRNSLYNDVPCNTVHPYICERED